MLVDSLAQDSPVIGILGLTYAPNSPVSKRSPTLRVGLGLVQRGIAVWAHDPHFTREEIEAHGFQYLDYPTQMPNLEILLVGPVHTVYSDLESRLRILPEPPQVIENLGVLRSQFLESPVPYQEIGGGSFWRSRHTTSTSV